jgi:uncharacterized protein (TIGR00661 family)
MTGAFSVIPAFAGNTIKGEIKPKLKFVKKIIVAPLNWGLGHAARCVPIIHFLLENKYVPIIASDGDALLFLQKEFPTLERLELPSYGISYAKNLKRSLVVQLPRILKAIRSEHKIIQKYIEEHTEVIGIISDNRFGVRSTRIPSVYITHQITVISGITTVISSKIHQKIIQKFDECWVPDSKYHKLSGLLSQVRSEKMNLKFIGVLSRFKKESIPKVNAILVVLSGIESQRKPLEEKMLLALKNYQGTIVLVQGRIQKEQTVNVVNGIKIYNYLLSSELEKEINQSELIICRSGYSSIMDLAVLHKKVFFIPTPNQPEQEYLASYLKEQNLAPFCKEQDFNVAQLTQVNNYKGLSTATQKLEVHLLRLFKGK